MSTRRNRKKQTAVAQVVTTEFEDNEAELLELQKIKAPIVWSNMPHGFVIEDLQEAKFEEALNLIKGHYMTENILCRNSRILEDEESLDDFMKQTQFFLRDRCSIYALDKESGRMAGVLVLRVLHQADYGKVFSRVKLIQGEAYKKICRVHAYINRKADIFEMFNCDKFLRCYLIAVHQDFRHRGVGFQMLRSAIDVSRLLDVPAIMGIFHSAKLQNKAKKVGMDIVFEIYYVDWLENNEMVFDDPGAGNYVIALMAGPVILNRTQEEETPEIEEKEPEKEDKHEDEQEEAAEEEEESDNDKEVDKN